MSLSCCLRCLSISPTVFWAAERYSRVDRSSSGCVMEDVSKRQKCDNTVLLLLTGELPGMPHVAFLVLQHLLRQHLFLLPMLDLRFGDLNVEGGDDLLGLLSDGFQPSYPLRHVRVRPVCFHPHELQTVSEAGFEAARIAQNSFQFGYGKMNVSPRLWCVDFFPLYPYQF